jgi:thymidylate kinase
MRLRYGRHTLAELILRLATPRPDVALWLSIDAATSARRKPGDQSARILQEMERLYAERARVDRLIEIDATAPRPAVAAQAFRLVDAAVATAGR